MVLESVGTYVGGKLFDWAIPRGIVVLSGTEKNRATRNAFEDAAASALADVTWEQSKAPSDEESARVLAEHLGTWLTEPSVAEKLFRAANAKVQADSKAVVELMEQTGFEVSIVPFDMKDFVTAFVPRLSEVVDREMRSQGLTETVLADKLDELLSRTEPRESAIRAAIPAADGPGRRAVLVGVRSFTRRAEDMEEMDHLLRLENHFDGRRIRSPELWREAVYPELDAFLDGNLNGHDRYLLHLSAHTTIAFACGYLLDPKSGVDMVPVQRTGGKQEWRPAVDPGEARRGLPEELWTLKPVPLRENGPRHRDGTQRDARRPRGRGRVRAREHTDGRQDLGLRGCVGRRAAFRPRRHSRAAARRRPDGAVRRRPVPRREDGDRAPVRRCPRRLHVLRGEAREGPEALCALRVRLRGRCPGCLRTILGVPAARGWGGTRN